MDAPVAGVWLGLAGGAVSFTHCLGMCGPFVLHLSGGQSRLGVLSAQLLWHLGKTSTYAFLGAVAGFLGGRIWNWGPLPWIQNGLAYVAGGVMVLMGLKLLGLWPVRRAARPAGAAADDAGILGWIPRQLFARPSPGGALVLGLGAGFLPCPVVLAFLAMSLHSRSVSVGMATMAAVSVGTAWSLLLLAAVGSVGRGMLRKWGSPVAASLLVLLGAATVLRGTPAPHQLLGGAACHDSSSAQSQPCAACTCQAPATQPAAVPDSEDSSHTAAPTATAP
jgi:uncharacterized protein